MGRFQEIPFLRTDYTPNANGVVEFPRGHLGFSDEQGHINDKSYTPQYTREEIMNGTGLVSRQIRERLNIREGHVNIIPLIPATRLPSSRTGAEAAIPSRRRA